MNDLQRFRRSFLDFEVNDSLNTIVGSTGESSSSESCDLILSGDRTNLPYLYLGENPNLISIQLPILEHITVGDLDFGDSLLLESFSAPYLTSVIGNFSGNNLPSLVTLDVPSLITVDTDLLILVSGIVSATFNALVTVGGAMKWINTTIVNFAAPNWLPTNGTVIDFSGCALSATSVNHILARCVAAAVTTCTINLSGGTSSAPTGQGIIDKADLITAGNTVTTN